MTEEKLCSHCGTGRIRPMHFNMEEALVICDNHECDDLLTTIPSETIVKRTLLAPTLPYQIGVRQRYGSSNSSSSGFVSEIRSPLLSPAPSTTTSLTDKEVELFFNPSHVQKELEKKRRYLENNSTTEKQGCKISEKFKTESCGDSNASTIEIVNSKHSVGSNCRSLKDNSSDMRKNHGNHEFLKALDKLELQEMENANVGSCMSSLQIISNSCRMKNEYGSLVIPSNSSAFSQVSPHRDINSSKNSCNMNKISIKQEVQNEATDLLPHSSNSLSFFSPVSSDDSGYTEEIINKQEIKRILENKQSNLNKGLTKDSLGELSQSSHYENVVQDLIKPSFPVAAVSISAHPAVISYDENSKTSDDRDANIEDNLASGDASGLPSASRTGSQNDSHPGSQLDDKYSNTEKSLDDSLINSLDRILENDINHAEQDNVYASSSENDMTDDISGNDNIVSNDYNTQENPIDSCGLELNPNIKSSVHGSVLVNPISPFNYSDRASAACSPNSFDQPSENDNFSDKASLQSNASDNSVSSFLDGKVDDRRNNKGRGRGRGRGRGKKTRESNLQNFDGLRGPSAVVPSKRSKIINVPEPVRVSQRSKQNIEFQATNTISQVNEDCKANNLASSNTSSASSVRRGLASLVHGSSEYGSLITSAAHRLSNMSYRSTPSGSFESDRWSILEMHVDQIDMEVVMGPKNSDKQEIDSKSQDSGKIRSDVKINENSTSSKVNAKETPKSPEEERQSISSSACKDNSTITFSSLKELHQMNAAKMFKYIFPVPNKGDLGKTKENKNSTINPLFKSGNVNVFTKVTKINSNNNYQSASSANTNPNSSLSHKISQPENRLSTSSSQYPVLVTPESKLVRSWGGTSEGNKPEENEFKTKSENIKKNSEEIDGKLDPIRYFNDLLSDVNFEDRFFQCPTSESLQNTFEEHLSSPLLFGETSESKSLSENIENKDIETETDLSSSVLKMLDEVMNESLELNSQKSSNEISECDLKYQSFSKDNLHMNSNELERFCKKDSRDQESVREVSNELNSLKRKNECQYPNKMEGNLIHDSSRTFNQCSVAQGRSELSSIKDTVSLVTNSKDLEVDKLKNQIETEQKTNKRINEIKEIKEMQNEIKDQVKERQNDAPKQGLKIKLIKSPDSRHEWSSDPSYISKLGHGEYYSGKKLDENVVNESVDNESIKGSRILSACSNEIDTTSNMKLLKYKDEKENDITLHYKNDDNELPEPSKKLSPFSTGTKEVGGEIVSDSIPGHLLNSTASSDTVDFNLSEDELDDDCPIIAINSDDEVEVLDDGINHVNVDKVNNIIENKDPSLFTPNSGDIHPLRCSSADTRDLYTLLSSDLEKSETNIKENDQEQDSNKAQNISSDLNRDSESNFESLSQQQANLSAHEEEACCGILDNSISHGSQCRSPRLKEFVDFSFIERDDSNRQVYSPKTVRKKIFEDENVEKKTEFYNPKPPSPKEISLLKLQNEGKPHSLSINPNKIFFGCTKSGPQYDLHNSPKSDDSSPGFLEMSFPDQINMWQNTVEEVEHDRIQNTNSETPRFENKSLIDTTEMEFSGYQSEIDTLQPISGLANESCVYDASDEDDMESDCPSNYNARTIQKVKKECLASDEKQFKVQMKCVNQSLSRDETPLMSHKKIEKNDLEGIPFLMCNRNKKQSEAGTGHVFSAPSTSRQIDLPSNLPKENIYSKTPLFFENHDITKNASSFNENRGINHLLQSSKRPENTTYISNSVQEQELNYTPPKVQEQEFKYTPPKNYITSLPNKKSNSNTIHNTQQGGLEFLNDTYSRSRYRYMKEAINSELRRKSTNLHSTEIESDESCDSIDYKQPSDRKLFTLIPPSLRRIYDGQLSNSSRNSYNNQVSSSLKGSFHNAVSNTVLPQPSSSHNYSAFPRKKSLDNLWEKWASKSAMEESNSQSEETEQLSDTSNRTSSSLSHSILGSPSRKRKRPINEKDKSLMASNKFSKIIYSYKKGGFVCRPTPQMLRKISEMRKKEQENKAQLQENKAQLEKQKQEEQEARDEFSKERENILRMTRDDMIERRKRLKDFRMRNFARRYSKKNVDESLSVQYRTKLAKEKEIQRRTLETVNQVKERSSEKNEVPENIIVMVDGKMHLYHRDPYKT